MKINERKFKASERPYYHVLVEKSDAVANVLLEDVKVWAAENEIDADFSDAPNIFFWTEEDIGAFILRWS